MLYCCVCLEYENDYACIWCDRCKEGIICCDCIMELETSNDDPVQKCLICKNILISHTIKNIILNYLLYETDDSPLKKRWFNHFYLTDFYKDLKM